MVERWIAAVEVIARSPIWIQHVLDELLSEVLEVAVREHCLLVVEEEVLAKREFA